MKKNRISEPIDGKKEINIKSTNANNNSNHSLVNALNTNIKGKSPLSKSNLNSSQLFEKNNSKNNIIDITKDKGNIRKITDMKSPIKKPINKQNEQIKQNNHNKNKVSFDSLAQTKANLGKNSKNNVSYGVKESFKNSSGKIRNTSNSKTNSNIKNKFADSHLLQTENNDSERKYDVIYTTIDVVSSNSKFVSNLERQFEDSIEINERTNKFLTEGNFQNSNNDTDRTERTDRTDIIESSIDNVNVLYEEAQKNLEEFERTNIIKLENSEGSYKSIAENDIFNKNLELKPGIKKFSELSNKLSKSNKNANQNNELEISIIEEYNLFEKKENSQSDIIVNNKNKLDSKDYNIIDLTNKTNFIPIVKKISNSIQEKRKNSANEIKDNYLVNENDNNINIGNGLNQYNNLQKFDENLKFNNTLTNIIEESREFKESGVLSNGFSPETVRGRIQESPSNVIIEKIISSENRILSQAEISNIMCESNLANTINSKIIYENYLEMIKKKTNENEYVNQLKTKNSNKSLQSLYQDIESSQILFKNSENEFINEPLNFEVRVNETIKFEELAKKKNDDIENIILLQKSENLYNHDQMRIIGLKSKENNFKNDNEILVNGEKKRFFNNIIENSVTLEIDTSKTKTFIKNGREDSDENETNRWEISNFNIQKDSLFKNNLLQVQNHSLTLEPLSRSLLLGSTTKDKTDSKIYEINIIQNFFEIFMRLLTCMFLIYFIIVIFKMNVYLDPFILISFFFSVTNVITRFKLLNFHVYEINMEIINLIFLVLIIVIGNIPTLCSPVLYSFLHLTSFFNFFTFIVVIAHVSKIIFLYNNHRIESNTNTPLLEKLL